MDVDRLFVYTLRELERRSNATDEYEVLMSAALLRKLLLDGGRLMDQVNRSYRLEIRFRFGGISPYEQWIHRIEPMFWAIEDVLDPDSGFAPPVEAKLDDFLRRRVMRYGGVWITVRDVIDHLANVEGAVHRGEPKKQRQKVLQAAGQFYSRSGLPGVVSQVRLIGRIALRGLTPLRDAVGATGALTWASVSPNGSVEVHRHN